MLKNLQDVIKLCLRNSKEAKAQQNNRFVGIQNLELSHA